MSYLDVSCEFDRAFNFNVDDVVHPCIFTEFPENAWLRAVRNAARLNGRFFWRDLAVVLNRKRGSFHLIYWKQRPRDVRRTPGTAVFLLELPGVPDWSLMPLVGFVVDRLRPAEDHLKEVVGSQLQHEKSKIQTAEDTKALRDSYVKFWKNRSPDVARTFRHNQIPLALPSEEFIP